MCLFGSLLYPQGPGHRAWYVVGPWEYLPSQDLSTLSPAPWTTQVKHSKLFEPPAPTTSLLTSTPCSLWPHLLLLGGDKNSSILVLPP